MCKRSRYKLGSGFRDRLTNGWMEGMNGCRWDLGTKSPYRTLMDRRRPGVINGGSGGKGGMDGWMADG